MRFLTGKGAADSSPVNDPKEQPLALVAIQPTQAWTSNDLGGSIGGDGYGEYPLPLTMSFAHIPPIGHGVNLSHGRCVLQAWNWTYSIPRRGTGWGKL